MKRSVLVLDDDQELRQEVAELLAAAGHQVSTRGDANGIESGLEGIDVLLLDLSLPGADGIDVLRRLKAARARLRVIVMSGHGEPIMRAVAHAAEEDGLPVAGVLGKPVDPEKLLALVEASQADRKVPFIAPAEDLVEAVAAAVAADRLEIQFQPKVDARTFRFRGAEALLSGVLPGIGPASPPDVVAAAKRKPGLLVDLSCRVVEHALDACATWQRAGFKEPVSVNLPAEVLQEPGAAATLIGLVRASGLPSDALVVELVEDCAYDTSPAALNVLAKLRLAGIGLALDDVGKRQSGLLQLANLPVTEIKIDLELIHQARTWEKARDILGSLVELGHRLGLSVVAEGVESEADLALVRQTSVDAIQGFLVSRKRPLSALLESLPDFGRAAAQAELGHS